MTAQPFEGELISVARFVIFTMLDGKPTALNADQIVGVQPSELGGSVVYLTTRTQVEVMEGFETVVDLLNP